MRWMGLAVPLLVLAACDGAPPVATSKDLLPTASVEQPKPVEVPPPEPVWMATGPALKTIPAAFHGRWGATAESCDWISDAGLTVTKDLLSFYETDIGAETVTPVGPDTFQIKGTGYEEDYTFEADVVIQLSADGKTLITNPGPKAFARVKCLKPERPWKEIEKELLEQQKQRNQQ